MPTMASISTERMHGADKLAQWQQSAWLETGHSRSHWIQGTSFHGVLEYGSLEEIKLYRLAVTPHQVMSSPEAKRQPIRGLVKAIFQVKGTTHYEQLGRQVLLEPGSWMLRDIDLPYSIDIQDGCELIALLLPRATIASSRFDLPDLYLRRFSGSSGMGRLIHNLIYNTSQEFGLLDELRAFDVASAITQLIRSYLLGMCSEQTEQSLCEVLQERVRRYIESHLRAPDLSLDKIARAMHCTKRYLHKAFENESVSISEYILNLRLERCRDTLSKTSAKDKSITDIALSWGFNNSAHFSRVFHNRFGVTPRMYRCSALTEDSAESKFRIMNIPDRVQ